MTKTRMEAFSDGVIAIIITVMVLELKAPIGTDLSALLPLWPIFLSYVLSFIFLAIYWNNHHHLMQAVHTVSGRVLWANLHLLFWLSLVPFCTAWTGENHFASLPVALYGLVFFFAGFAYFLLTHALIAHHGRGSTIDRAVGSDRKGKASVLVYAIAIPLAFVRAWWAFALYVLVAIIWIVPDKRIERALSSERKD